MSDSFSLPRFERMAGEVDGHPFVLLSIPGGVAACEIGLARETAGLRRFWVAPEVRRKGVGRLLFERAIDEARAAGKLALSWQVKKDNSRALLFYGAMGAHIVHDDGDGYYWMSVPLVNPETQP